MLRGMGFDNNTSVYIAAGKIYKADKYMAPLKQMFPRLETKDTIASAEELAPFEVLLLVHFFPLVCLYIVTVEKIYILSYFVLCCRGTRLGWLLSIIQCAFTVKSLLLHRVEISHTS